MRMGDFVTQEEINMICVIQGIRFYLMTICCVDLQGQGFSVNN